MTKDQITRWFIQNYPDLYNDMRNSEHSPRGSINPYHGEGSVWTHTMMVMIYLDAKFKNSILTIAGLLHDIGKPEVQEFIPACNDKPDKYRFSNHESVSAIKSIEILNHLQKDFKISNNDKDLIFKIISLHGTYLENKDVFLLDYLMKFREGDKNGAIRIDPSEMILTQYTPRKFLKRKEQERTKHCIIAVGMPNSGKSTFFNDPKYSDYFILSRDKACLDFFELKNNRKCTYNEAFEFSLNSEGFEDYFNEMIKKAKLQKNVIVDMTMLSLKSRRKMISNFPDFNLDCKVFATCMKTIQEREIKRSKEGKSIPEGVYFNMMKTFVVPVLDEGFNSIEIVWNSEK